LPLYSWYPGFVKRYCERLAVTTRPALANHATYPATHWFTFSGLGRFLAARHLRPMDRFDVMDLGEKSEAARAVVRLLRAVPPARWLGHVATPYTLVAAIKQAPA